jgi:2-methylisocitrate lyase-like PEP mutase family enzyme
MNRVPDMSCGSAPSTFGRTVDGSARDGGDAGQPRRGTAAGAAGRTRARLVIIARTDARAVEGLDAALERARRYRDAGADVLFVEAPESEAEVAAVAQAFPETPLLFNAVEGGRTPLLGLARLRELGFRLVLCPLTALLAATAAVQHALADLRHAGTPLEDGALSFSGFTELIGLPEIQRLEARYAAAPGPPAQL